MAETNTSTPAVVLQVPTTVKALIEALIFGAREPLSMRQIQALYEDQSTAGGEPRKIDYEEVKRTVDELNAEYTASDRPYRIIQIAGGYQFATLPQYAEWLGKLYKEQTRRKLSQSSIETLAIIAYKQPITKPEIESIRGVNCDYVLSTLLEKDLATIVGRAPTVGRPLLYGTSREFLRHFGLNDLNDLPRPREIQEILGDSQFETERRMLEAQQGVEEKKEEEFKSRLPHIPKRKPGLDNEVKILPKKRVRDINIRKSEEPEAEKPVESVSAESTDIPAAPAVQDAPAPAGPETAGIPEVPFVEKIDETQSAVQEPVEEISVPNDEVTASLPLISYIPVSESRPVEDATAGFIEDGKPEEDQVAEELPVPASTESAQLPTFAQPVTAEEELVEPLNQVEKAELTSIEERDLQIVAEPIVQEEPPVPVAETIQVPTEEIPLAVPPTIEEHSEPPVPVEPDVLADKSHVGAEAPHSKTRWKTWKEKIQGFIKKLFG